MDIFYIASDFILKVHSDFDKKFVDHSKVLSYVGCESKHFVFSPATHWLREKQWKSWVAAMKSWDLDRSVDPAILPKHAPPKAKRH